MAESLQAVGFEIRSQIIWAKERLVLSRGHYHWQYEPAWYAVRGTGHWSGARKQSTLWNIPNRDQDAATVHGTLKPVECMRRPILNNSSPGQAVYEPFCGSGTTIIAAETTGRVCHAVESDPAYVDVAMQRWQTFTGREAVHAESGETFAAVADARGEGKSLQLPMRKPAVPEIPRTATIRSGGPGDEGVRMMAPRGPKPKPTRLKVLTGTARKHRLNPAEPDIEPAVPEAPDHLSDEARAEWMRVTGEMAQTGILYALDRGRWLPMPKPMVGGWPRSGPSGSWPPGTL